MISRAWTSFAGGITFLIIGAILGSAGTFESCARQAEQNLAADHALISNRDYQIFQLHNTIASLEATLEQQATEVNSIHIETLKRQAQAQQTMLADVQLNACEVAAKQLAAQQTQLPSQAQTIVAALVKAFLR